MRILVLFAALLVFVVGILFIATPIPLGFPLFIVGTALVLTASPNARVLFKRWRQKNPKISALILKYEPKLPRWLRAAMEETWPDKS
ncbi:MAG: hypothetical protein KDJ29_03245 [Hyphomicrobiales bacterium]|nr:hypothetical protein [Hyphomicrobiales bacterium]